MRKTLKRPVVSFTALSFLIFLAFFMLTGIGMMAGAPEILTHILQIISAWSSTIALVILFKKIYPGVRIKDFIKKQFAPKIKFSVLGTAIAIQLLIFTVTVFLLSGKPNIQSFNLSFAGVGALLFIFFDNLIRGPLGESLGWRGYLLNELQKKHSALLSALIKGVLWGLWHTPLWFVSGYNGLNLIYYITAFMIGIVSFTIITTFFYNLSKNLLVPIIMHQLFNFLIVLVKVDLLNILSYTASLYLIVAVILIIVNPKEILYKAREHVCSHLLF